MVDDFTGHRKACIAAAMDTTASGKTDKVVATFSSSAWTGGNGSDSAGSCSIVALFMSLYIFTKLKLTVFVVV